MTFASRVTPFLLVLLSVSPAASRADPGSDQQFLTAAKATRASMIESELPDIPIGAWLSSLVSAETPLSWALNDCGEQTGVPKIDSARDLPVCGELEASLGRGRSVYFYFLVGTRSNGVVDSRSLYFAGVLGGEKVLTFPSLSKLAAYIQGERE